VSGIYEIVARQTYDGKDCINVFEFATVNPLAAPNALELLTLLGFIPSGTPSEYPADTFFAAWRAAVSSGVTFVEFEARELYSLTDFYVAPALPGTTGDIVGGGYMSSFNALGLFSNRVRTDIRRGTKRLVGMSEGMVSNFGLLESAELVLLTAVADALSVAFDGAAATYRSCVISRERLVQPDGSVKYDLYETRDEQLEHLAIPVSWFPYPEVRTQNSRKD